MELSKRYKHSDEYYINNHGERKHPRKSSRRRLNEDIKQERLSLDQVQVWKIENGRNATYMICHLGLTKENCGETVAIGGKIVTRLLEEYGEYWGTAQDYLTKYEKKVYNEALDQKKIGACYDMLNLLQLILNEEQQEEVRR